MVLNARRAEPHIGSRPTVSFDHLVGTGEEGGRNGETARFGLTHIQNKLKAGRASPAERVG
jgi:hypothetical protein